ncbi:Uma2 family endonuclease [Gemmata sp.]|uniref:Uma2 family endonuclease n=1 Tax=Gemmata sp. TaxID=1914242 RepID=UPI003F701F59
MASAKAEFVFEDVGELLKRLGNIPAGRVCMNPLPGTATERDLLRMHGRPRKLYELVDGTLVEKGMGHKDSVLSFELGKWLGIFLQQHDLGYCTTADDLVRVNAKRVRGPDLTFVSWKSRPERTIPQEQISKQVPDLAVEVLSPGNTRKEMRIKLKEYFGGGVKLVWIIDPKTRTAEAYTAPDAKTAVPADGALDGGDVLPGFRLPLAQLFARFPAPTSAKKPSKRKKK